MVIKRLFAARGAPPCRIPDGERVYAIGDIHGCLDLLDRLLAMIDADEAQRPAAESYLVVLGDVIDRGPDSRGVVERLMGLRGGRRETRFLKGNHEEIFLTAVAGDPRATRLLSRVGGRETILSYGVTPDEYNELDFDELTALLGERVPPEHVAFLDGFDDWVETGDYRFVHAGIRPEVPMRDQKASDLRWIRDDFLKHRGAHDMMIVHGHNISEEVEVRPNRIGIDTGAYATGKLTAIGLEGGDRWFLST